MWRIVRPLINLEVSLDRSKPGFRFGFSRDLSIPSLYVLDPVEGASAARMDLGFTLYQY